MRRFPKNQAPFDFGTFQALTTRKKSEKTNERNSERKVLVIYLYRTYVRTDAQMDGAYFIDHR